MYFTFLPKYSFFVLPSNNWIGKTLDLLPSLSATLTTCPVFCSYRFWLETANHVPKKTLLDVIENIAIIVVFIKFDWQNSLISDKQMEKIPRKY